MKGIITTLLSAIVAAGTMYAGSILRAPAYPLITIDPYTSIWSMGDTLYADQTRHWTGAEHPIVGILTVDGIDYRFLGKDFVSHEMLAPTSEWGEWEAKYTFSKPDNQWTSDDFDDSEWASSAGAFATDVTGGKPVKIRNEYCKPGGRTLWPGNDVWLRRRVNLSETDLLKDIYLTFSCNDGAEFYINGKEIVKTGNNETEHTLIKLDGIAMSSLRPGENVIAAHCNNTVENGYIDFGLTSCATNGRENTQTARQIGVNLLPTQTCYNFVCGPVELKLTFTAPFLPEDLELASRPINYITYVINATDGKPHEVKIKFEVSPLLTMDYPGHPTIEKIEKVDNLTLLCCGTTTQKILEKWGDDRRIDWGYVYLCADSHDTSFSLEEKRFSMTRSLGDVKKSSGYLMLGYDDIYSIQYLGKNLRPYWNRTGQETIISQFEKAAKDYKSIMSRCEKFNSRLMSEAEAAGGLKYAQLCALSWRQTFAAHKLVESPTGIPVYLSKENFSNGSVGTVDLSYPSIPLFLIYNVELAKGLMNPIFEYCATKEWNKPFAAHDIGRYPLANGQNYGGDMPVEESGNMLIMSAAIAHMEGNANFAKKNWNQLTQWVNYLMENGFDPENQLCTDDFAGHLAHNTNLSAKAILGIASYGYLAGMIGDVDDEAKYINTARKMAKQWEKMADDGNHYRLTFDKSDTWSLKYNLVWDKILGLNIFSPEIAKKEIAFYKTKNNQFGIPLDCREKYSKTDWIVWSATLADNRADFEDIIHPLWLFMNETPDRVPMADWIWTDQPYSKPFRNRSVVGGHFMKLLDYNLNHNK